ncbi:MAG: ribonuclease T [Francisellaceae bacterium]|jgi:ribonuclease T|nr:ribonuclease T [Francisellaceae bacterium]MBT6539495.1 ribonuclease T [Francisellaceae bacterium]
MESNNLTAKRFRGFLPVVVDVETTGVDPRKNAILEFAMYPITVNSEKTACFGEGCHYHVDPFEGAVIDRESMEFHKIDPNHPFRFAKSEKEALTKAFEFISKIQKEQRCNRCVLVAHNSWFDLHFIQEAAKRSKISNPFHLFTSFDTATLSAAMFGKTVLAQAAKTAKIHFDLGESHSALYDTKKTAELFCHIINQLPWPANLK